jgi:urease subunit alpha
VGKLADIVLWEPGFFGAKPSLVLKAGFPAWGAVGDPNASVDRAEPLTLGPQFGAHGAAPADLSVAFVNEAFEGSTTRRQVPVRGCRNIGLADMVRNTTVGTTVVDPEGARVTFDGETLTADPAVSVSLNRLYFL